DVNPDDVAAIGMSRGQAQGVLEIGDAVGRAVEEASLEVQVDQSPHKIGDVRRLPLDRSREGSGRRVAERDSTEGADRRNLVDVGEAEAEVHMRPRRAALREAVEELDGAVVLARGDHGLAILRRDQKILWISRHAGFERGQVDGGDEQVTSYK